MPLGNIKTLRVGMALVSDISIVKLLLSFSITINLETLHSPGLCNNGIGLYYHVNQNCTKFKLPSDV